MQRHQAVGRAHKMYAAPAGQLAVGLQLVAHDFGDGQPGQGFFKRFLQAGIQAGTCNQAVIKQGWGLAVGRLAQGGHGGCGVGDIGTQRLQFLEQRRCRLTRRVQPHAHGHELLLHGFVGGLEPDPGDVRGQTAWRGKRGHHRFIGGQALGAQLVGQHGGKGLTQLLEHLGREFFDEQFNEKIFGCHLLGFHPALKRPFWASAPPTRAGPWESPAARDSRNNSALPPAPDCGCGRCRPRARSR